jgi:UDP-N-acetylmuramate dehydrogenase
MSSPASPLADSLRAAGFTGELRPHEPLAPYTTWQIGGPAELLAVPASVEDLVSALAWAASQGIPWRLLGNGSNLLIHDQGVRGLVLRVRKVLDEIKVDGQLLTAGAGASFPAVAKTAAARGLAGLQFAAGIPGTVGGAVVMNAGWHQFETGNVIVSVDFLHADGRRTTMDREQCAFTYRGSSFQRTPGVVLGATFQLEPGDPAVIQAEVDEYTSARKLNQPVDRPSCGSVYLQPPGDFAGRLIDAAGLKGRRVGGMEVSNLHANFFINTGDATCADALALMEQVEQEVGRQFGVELVREVEFWQ